MSDTGSAAGAAASSAGGNKLRLKLSQVKQENEEKGDVDMRDETEQMTIKREVIDLDDESTTTVSTQPPMPPPPSKRPTFSLTSMDGSAVAASTTATTAAASSSTATASAAPLVLNQNSVRLRMRKRPKSILDYLCSLDKNVLDALYRDTFTCLTIFRSLHPLAKQYLLRWLCITDALPLSIINSWVLDTPTSQAAHTQAMNTLWELQLLIRAPNTSPTSIDSKHNNLALSTESSDPLIHFNPPFQKCLQDALSNKLSSSGAFGIDAAAITAQDPQRPSLEELESYAQATWDGILHWMVGASQKSAFAIPSSEVTSRLASMGLMEPLSSDPRVKPRITPSGFAFLFKDIQTQVWDIILEYMEKIDKANVTHRDEVLQFLFRLSFLKLGFGYPVDQLTEVQRKVLYDLVAFGLIWMKDRRAKMYYPTRLSLNLSAAAGSVTAPNTAAASASSSSSGGAAPGTTVGEGYIILETTFRLYAFTTSPFHTALLGLFCRLDIALPNLLVGTITKESIRSALKQNISSTEIITYLESYARADMKVNTPVLPENVIDQIRLWEQERNRLSLTDSYLFEFDSNDTEQVMKLVLLEAFKQSDQILLHHAQKKLLVVTPAGYQRLKAFKLRLNEQLALAAQQMKQ